MPTILDGQKIAAEIRQETIEIITEIGFPPKLDVVLVGNNKPSEVYVGMKTKACDKLGIDFTIHRLSEKLTEHDVKDVVLSLNETKSVHGILVQLPLPSHINQNSILSEISRNKDVDCFNPHNLGRLLYGDVVFHPCTASAVIQMLKFYDVPLIGKHVVVINDSILLGKPLSILLTNLGATVLVCNKQTDNIKSLSKQADVIVVGVGRRKEFVLDESFCKLGVKIIDCGIYKYVDVEGNSIVCGDVDIDSVKGIASMVSAVPKGIGPITIEVLLRNVALAAKRCHEMESKKSN